MTNPCEQVRLDLPWYLNGTLDAPARELVDAHLPECRPCQLLLLEEQRLMARLRARDARIVPMPQGAWKGFEQRLDGVVAAGSAPPAAKTAPPPGPAVRVPVVRLAGRGWRIARRVRRRALVVAVAAQAVALVVLAALLWSRAPEPVAVYRTLTTTTPQFAGGDVMVRVVLVPGTAPERARVLARQSGMRVVAGPRNGAIYTFAVTPGPAAVATRDVATSVARLRAQPEVLLAEAVAGDTPAGTQITEPVP